MQALLFGGDTVMLGSVLAGTIETPGDTVQKPVVIPESHKTVKVPFKVFRGMASLQAIVDRLDVEDSSAADVEALGAEGMEISVPARGSVRPVAPRHAEAPLLGDQLRRRVQPGRTAAEVPDEPGALRDSADRIQPPRIV